MNLIFRRISLDGSEYLVEVAAYNESAIKYALEVDSSISYLASTVKNLNCLMTNASASQSNGQEALDFEKLDDKRFMEILEEYFIFKNEDSDNNHLNDNDYVEIANLRYPNEYDRCVVIKSSFIFKEYKHDGSGRDFSHWQEFYRYNFKVVVRKGFDIDETKEYSLDEIISMIESRDIIVAYTIPFETSDPKDFKKAVIFEEKVGKLNTKEWLCHVDEEENSFHSFYMAYIKSFVTEELINMAIDNCTEECRKVLEYPEDELIINMLSWNKNQKSFEGMSDEEKLQFVKDYEKSHDIIRKAKEIIFNYSEAIGFFPSIKNE